MFSTDIILFLLIIDIHSDELHFGLPGRLSPLGSSGGFGRTAPWIPTVCAQTAPLNRKIPARRTVMPRIRWTQPQVEISNSKIHLKVTTYNSLYTTAASPLRIHQIPIMIIMKRAKAVQPIAHPLGSLSVFMFFLHHLHGSLILSSSRSFLYGRGAVCTLFHYRRDTAHSGPLWLTSPFPRRRRAT